MHYDDKILGKLIARMRDRGLTNSTVVIVTGDHGMYFSRSGVDRFHGKAASLLGMRLFYLQRLWAGLEHRPVYLSQAQCSIFLFYHAI